MIRRYFKFLIVGALRDNKIIVLILVLLNSKTYKNRKIQTMKKENTIEKSME